MDMVDENLKPLFPDEDGFYNKPRNNSPSEKKLKKHTQNDISYGIFDDSIEENEMSDLEDFNPTVSSQSSSLNSEEENKRIQETLVQSNIYGKSSAQKNYDENLRKITEPMKKVPKTTSTTRLKNLKPLKKDVYKYHSEF